MFEFDQKQLDKLAALREAGVEPYPNGLTVDATSAAVLEAAGERSDEELQGDEREFCVAGRLRAKREMGKAGFAKLQDVDGLIQLYIRRDEVGEEPFRQVWRKLDLGDQVWIRGRLMRSRTGETTLRVQEIRLYAKCLESMPDKHHGFQDGEQRQRMRYVDLFMNESTRETFRRRSAIVRYIRDYFEARGFLEVETPMLQLIPGGATARPFTTHHNALGLDMYLRVAPELFLKRLVVGGLEKVYEINRNFRNEGISLRHNPEFTMLEFYWAHATFHDLMDLTEELLSGLAGAVCGSTDVVYQGEPLDFSAPWRRARMDELIVEATGIADPWDAEACRAFWIEEHPSEAGDPDLPSTPGKWFERLFDEYVEGALRDPTFVTHYPTEISPLSRRSPDEPRVTDRFELVVVGRELANGFSELNDPVDQAARFEAQARAKAGGDDEAMFFDDDYVRALSYGMPATAGEGIGIDRLVMLLTDQASIREVILFPTLRPQADANAGD